jgi:hypothetical protein
VSIEKYTFNKDHKIIPHYSNDEDYRDDDYGDEKLKETS